MSRSLKILLTNSTDIYGGGEFYVLELAKELQRRQHNVWVCVKPDHLLRKKCEEASIRTIPVDFPPQGELLRFTIKLKQILKEYKIDIIHTNSNYDRTAGAFAARMAGVVHVTNVHSFHSLQHNVTHWLRNAYATDHYIVDGVCVRDLLVKEDHIPTSKISVVHLGVDPQSMKRDTLARMKIREELRITDDMVVIGNVGRLVPMKGQEYLLRAFALIVRQFPKARVILVGDGELRDQLLKLAQELMVQEYVTFAGFRDDLSALYSAFDVYVHTSVEGGGETFPFAVLQALAQGLPVVVTRVGDVSEMVEEGVNGFVVPEKSPNEIVEKLILLLIDQLRRESMSARSRQRLMNFFTLERMVSSIEHIYFSLINSK